MCRSVRPQAGLARIPGLKPRPVQDETHLGGLTSVEIVHTRVWRWVSRLRQGLTRTDPIDESQELFYPAVMRAIRDTGFTGYVAQEFVPESTDRMAGAGAALAI